MLYGSSTFCTNGTVDQNRTWHYIPTAAYGGNRACGRGLTATQFAQAQSYYKTPLIGQPGTYCGSVGWIYSPTGIKTYQQFNNWDIWSYFGNACNNGVGVNVYITIDSWQYAMENGVWQGGVWRPATWHCRCP